MAYIERHAFVRLLSKTFRSHSIPYWSLLLGIDGPNDTTILNDNLLSIHFQSVHYHRWFVVGLKVNCIIMWNNKSAIYKRIIGCMKKQTIRKNDKHYIDILFTVGKLLYVWCHVNKALYSLCPSSTINVVFSMCSMKFLIFYLT